MTDGCPGKMLSISHLCFFLHLYGNCIFTKEQLISISIVFFIGYKYKVIDINWIPKDKTNITFKNIDFNFSYDNTSLNLTSTGQSRSGGRKRGDEVWSRTVLLLWNAGAHRLTRWTRWLCCIFFKLSVTHIYIFFCSFRFIWSFVRDGLYYKSMSERMFRTSHYRLPVYLNNAIIDFLSTVFE